MSRVLIWSPNYAREPIGIPPLVTDAGERFVRRGHSVDAVTAVPNYPERRTHPEYVSLAEGMRHRARDAGLRERIGQSARCYAEQKLAKDSALERVKAVLS